MTDALSIVKRRAAEAEANRLAMPEVSRWINLQEAQFGKSKVRYASEGEIIRGRRGQFYEVSAAQMCLIIDGQQYVWERDREQEISIYAGADIGKLRSKRKNAASKRSPLP